MSGTDEPIIDAVITASDELFPGYTGTGSGKGGKKCGCSQKKCKKDASCCGGSCGCHTQENNTYASNPLEGIEPIPLGKTRAKVPLSEEQIKKIAEITARDLENDDDDPSEEEIELLKQMFGVK